MDRFWNLIQKIFESLKQNGSEMMEFEFESENDSESFITFHTDDKGNLIMSVFDADQWSLIQDMSAFADKGVEEIVRELDPSGPNIHVIDPDGFSGPWR